MLRWFRADLHIHTCLSPCGDLTMSPKRIVERAVAKKLDIIGICDHNSAENVVATIKAAKKSKLKVLAGMEIASSEDVHIIALFDDAADTLALQGSIYDRLQPGENNPKVFGDQIIVNEFDEIEGYNNRLLIGSTRLTSGEITKKIHRLNGFAVAAHVDRPSYSIISQLGFIPDDLNLEALEISSGMSAAEVAKKFPETEKYPLIASSDAHFLADIGSLRTDFYLTAPTITEIKKALMNKDRRKVEIKH